MKLTLHFSLCLLYGSPYLTCAKAIHSVAGPVIYEIANNYYWTQHQLRHFETCSSQQMHKSIYNIRTAFP